MKFIGFLRGINVGGNHIVPMAELKKILTELGFKNVKTLLNSGNFVFETNSKNISELEQMIENQLFKSFNFNIPLILKTVEEISNLVEIIPFKSKNLHKDIRFYVSFLKNEPNIKLELPYFSKDQTFQIISIENKIICSVFDLSLSKTPKGMDDLEKIFGKNITTRNWNTILRLHNI